MKPELGTKPRVYYRNLWRYTKCFISGSVSTTRAGVIECLDGAKVQLVKNNGVIAELETDNFGDFKFDGLEENSGSYAVVISTSEGRTQKVETTLGASVHVGEVRI